MNEKRFILANTVTSNIRYYSLIYTILQLASKAISTKFFKYEVLFFDLNHTSTSSQGYINKILIKWFNIFVIIYFNKILI